MSREQSKTDSLKIIAWITAPVITVLLTYSVIKLVEYISQNL